MQITISTRENEEGGEIGGGREREREARRKRDNMIHNYTTTKKVSQQ